MKFVHAGLARYSRGHAGVVTSNQNDPFYSDRFERAHHFRCFGAQHICYDQPSENAGVLLAYLGDEDTGFTRIL